MTMMKKGYHDEHLTYLQYADDIHHIFNGCVLAEML
jgi:hypothetical protein